MPHDAHQPLSQTIQVAFPVVGEGVPLDHGHALFTALSRIPGAGPWLRDSDAVAIHPIRGRDTGAGWLQLTPDSRLTLAIAPDDLPRVLPLAGQALAVGGGSISLGDHETSLLHPAPSVHCRLVILGEAADESGFEAAIGRELFSLEIRGELERGPRRALRVMDQTLMGYAVSVHGLSPEDSIHLQEAGLGGWRKLGAGVFAPLVA